jgi:hypothetical protein
MSLFVFGVRPGRASMLDANIRALTVRRAEIQVEICTASQHADPYIATLQEELDLCNQRIFDASQAAISRRIFDASQTIISQQAIYASQTAMNQQNSGTIPGPRTRHPFSLYEDALLQSLVSIHGSYQWNRIADIMNRTPRQCRERWKNYLSPPVVYQPWTPEEEQDLLSAMREIGPRWQQIGVRLNRAEVDVKNHYHFHVKPALEGRVVPKRKRRPLISAPVILVPAPVIPVPASVIPIGVHRMLQVADTLAFARQQVKSATVDPDANPGNNIALEFDLFDTTRSEEETSSLDGDFPVHWF